MRSALARIGKKIKEKAIDIKNKFNESGTGYTIFNNNKKIKTCELYIDCTNARKLKRIYEYLVDNKKENKEVDVEKNKIKVLFINTNPIIKNGEIFIKTINTNGTIKTKTNINIDIDIKTKICIKTDREYTLCKENFKYTPLIVPYKNIQEYITKEYEYSNRVLDKNICKILITCENAMNLANQIALIAQNKIYNINPGIKIRVYSKYLKDLPKATIISINSENDILNFTIKYDNDSNIRKIIENETTFDFFSLCITNNNYKKYSGICNVDITQVEAEKKEEKAREEKAIEEKAIEAEKREEEIKREAEKKEAEKREEEIKREAEKREAEKKEERKREEERKRKVIDIIKTDQNKYKLNCVYKEGKYRIHYKPEPGYMGRYFISCIDAIKLIDLIYTPSLGVNIINYEIEIFDKYNNYNNGIFTLNNFNIDGNNNLYLNFLSPHNNTIPYQTNDPSSLDKGTNLKIYMQDIYVYDNCDKLIQKAQEEERKEKEKEEKEVKVETELINSNKDNITMNGQYYYDTYKINQEKYTTTDEKENLYYYIYSESAQIIIDALYNKESLDGDKLKIIIKVYIKEKENGKYTYCETIGHNEFQYDIALYSDYYKTDWYIEIKRFNHTVISNCLFVSKQNFRKKIFLKDLIIINTQDTKYNDFIASQKIELTMEGDFIKNEYNDYGYKLYNKLYNKLNNSIFSNFKIYINYANVIIIILLINNLNNYNKKIKLPESVELELYDINTKKTSQLPNINLYLKNKKIIFKNKKNKLDIPLNIIIIKDFKELNKTFVLTKTETDTSIKKQDVIHNEILQFIIEKEKKKEREEEEREDEEREAKKQKKLKELQEAYEAMILQWNIDTEKNLNIKETYDNYILQYNLNDFFSNFISFLNDLNTLNINNTEKPSNIKKNYRAFSMIYHSDKCKVDPKFQAVKDIFCIDNIKLLNAVYNGEKIFNMYEYMDAFNKTFKETKNELEKI